MDKDMLSTIASKSESIGRKPIVSERDMLESIASEQAAQHLNLKSTIQELPLYEACIKLDGKTSQAVKIFKDSPQLPGIILMEDSRLAGMISQKRFFESINHRKSLNLFGKRSLQELHRFADTEMLVLHGYTSISAAVWQCLRRSRELFDEPIVVNIAPGIYKLLDVQQLLLAQAQLHEQAMATLQESEAKFRCIHENSPVMMHSIDENGNICNANRKWLEETGYSWSEVKGQRADFLMTPESRVRAFSKVMPQLWRDGCVRDVPYQYVKKDGTIMDVLLDCHITTNAAGKRVNIAIVRNTTRRKQIEQALCEAKEQLRAVLDAVPGFVSWIGSDLRYLGVNQHLATCFNLSPEAFVGKEIGFLNITPNLKETMSEFFASTAETISYEMTAQIEGTVRSYLMVAQKYNRGEAAVTVGVDITKIKKLEEDLRQALLQEKELSLLKSRFVAMTSHEFRTPLTTILSSAELLERYSYKWSEDKKLHHIDRIQTAVKCLIKLLDDILTIGKAEAGRLELKPVALNVEKFCKNLVEELQVNDNGKHTIIFTDRCDRSSFCLDEKALRHILSNLLSNAVKYSPPDSTVRFDSSFQNEALIFKVQDEGIGIPLEDQRRLFEPFHRAANVGSLSGTGLGLAIVKKCVDLQGGQLTVESQVGTGTAFTVVLPVNAAACAKGSVSGECFSTQETDKKQLLAG